MLRLPRSSVRRLHVTVTQCNSRIRKQHVEHLPADKLDSLASMLEQNAKVDTKTNAQETLFEMLEQDRPKSTNLRKMAYEKLLSKIDSSYTVHQLQSYLRSQNIPAPKHKTALVERIVKKAWGIESPEERVAAREVLSEVFPSTKRDLVLLISDHGQYLQQVQNETSVSITVQSHDQSLLLQGRKKAIEEAKKMLLNLPEPVEITRRQAAIPGRWQELERLIPEISKLTQAFISPEQDGVIRVSGNTQANVDSANRLLDVVSSKLKLAKSTQSPDQANETFLRSMNGIDDKNLAFMPFYDPVAMPIETGISGWSRLQRASSGDDRMTAVFADDDIQDQGIISVYNGSQSTNLSKLSDVFKREFEDFRSSNIDIYASFGNLLFQNPSTPAQNSPNYIHSPINGTFSISDFQRKYDWKQERQCFFSSQPSNRLTLPYTPLSLKPQRSVTLEFIDSDFWKSSRTKSHQRLLVDFDINSDFALMPQTVQLEKQRSVVDFLSLNSPDVRICGRVYQPIIKNGQHLDRLDGDHQETVDTIQRQCQLIDQDKIDCPKYADVAGTRMTLFGVKLQTKREFLIKESNVLTVSDVVDQDGGIRSRQVTLRPFDPASQTYPDNALLQWDSFINSVTHIMTRWHL
ncbi:hypothetical protein BGW37DRAFT_503115 [Umbelopsis sp. PMI_123]|nr:hypothetical protein BGW37DRAFT_503115 [Umbelopsis sp. PMI_123]